MLLEQNNQSGGNKSGLMKKRHFKCWSFSCSSMTPGGLILLNNKNSTMMKLNITEEHVRIFIHF